MLEGYLEFHRLAREFLEPVHTPLAEAMVLAIVMDILTTVTLVRRFGPEAEGNPLLRAIMRRWGVAGYLTLWGAMFAFFLPGVLNGPTGCLLFTLMFGGCAVWNVTILRRSGKSPQLGAPAD